MKKTLFLLIFWISWLSDVQATSVPSINAAAFIVSDEQSGQILMQHEAEAKIEPAALTQLMTAYLVFQAIDQRKLNLNQSLVVSDQSWHTPGSRLFMQPKQSLSTKTIIQGMITLAANDAAMTLAQAVAGNEAAFVKIMNIQAKKMGLKNSHFINCTGLPNAGQYSSTSDILILAQALWRDFPQYRSWFGKTEFTEHGLTQLNHNLLLFRGQSVKGMATSYSITGGYNIVANSQEEKRHIMAIVMGADSSASRAIEAGKLLTWAQQEFNTIAVFNVNQPIAQLAVYHGKQDSIPIGFTQNAYITLPNSIHSILKSELEVVQPVVAPIRKGAVLGKLSWIHNNTVVAQKDVVALEDVPESNWLQQWYEKWHQWWRQLFS